MSSLPPNTGKNIAVDEICIPCERTEIIPILPVRYALGQFDLAPLNLNYPSVDELISSNFEPVNGMVARLLRSGYVYIYIENGAKKQADEGGDDLPSYQDKWHIFYYHSPNPDAEGNISELGGLFVKQKIEENDDHHLVYQRFKNSNNSLIKRTYAFIPPTCSTIYIAFSAYEWSIHMLDTVMSDPKKRAKHMQKSGTTLAINESCAWPLQQFAGAKPTDDNLKNGSSEQFNTTLASFVQELNPANKVAKKSAAEDDSFLDKLLLSVTPSIPYSAAKIAQVHNTTKNKIEVGKVIALHDPIDISQDLAAFHGAVSISHAHEIMENQYAYLTYQAIETQLGSALPNVDNPFSNKFNQSLQYIDEFEARVSAKQREAQAAAMRQGAIFNPRKLQQDFVQLTKDEMNASELKALEEAGDFYTANKPSSDMKAAVALLNPKFNETRNTITANANEIKKALKKSAKNIQVWNTQVSGAGSIAFYHEILTEECKASDVMDKLRALTHIFAISADMSQGLEAAKEGKMQIDNILYPYLSEESEMRYDIAALLKIVSSFVTDQIGVMTGAFVADHDKMLVAKRNILVAADRFLITMANSPKTSLLFASEVRELGLGKENLRPAKVRELLEKIAKMQGVDLKIKRKPLRQFVKALNQQSGAIKAWNDSSVIKYYGALLDRDLQVLTINNELHFNAPNGALRGFGGLAFISYLYGLYVTGPELQKLQSQNSSKAKEMLGLKNIYHTVVLAEAGAFALRKNADEIIGATVSKVLKKIKLPTSLGMSPSTGKLGAKGIAITTAKSLLKTTPVIGLIDAITNVFQAMTYWDRNDQDAVLFAGSSVVGGALLVLSAIAGAVGIFGAPVVGATMAAAVTVLAAPLASVAVVLVAVGAIGKMIAENSQLENWVAEGFWGGKESGLFKTMPKYLYWGSVKRTEIIFENESNNQTDAFPAQLSIAKLASGGVGTAITPQVSKKEVIAFMQSEMSDYHSQNYGPHIKKDKKTILAVLPEFSVGLSVFELKLEVQEEGFIGGNTSNYGKQTFFYTYNLPGDGEELWQRVPNTDIFRLAPKYHKMNQVNKINYAYYPQGKGDQALKYSDEIELNFFD